MQCYMKFPGVPGNSKGKWAGWLTLESVHFGLRGPRDSKTDIMVVREVDSSSPPLQRAAFNGEPNDVEIVFVDGDSAPHLHVVLSGAIVSSYQVVRKHDGAGSVENIAFNYEKLTSSASARSTPQNAQDAQHAAKGVWAIDP
ncbi:MAG: type VI secretion system tube protein Hcp [Acidobacteriota bacterium]|nr:MAG: type VI secretion system tube protein Hcp [Acidobacteriota bacterium]